MAEQRESLDACLTRSLPDGVTLTYHHISTPPSSCSPLYSPPQNEDPEKTYCELQSLLATIDSRREAEEDSDVAVFAIELQIYTTAKLTTVFISKADSTGYLSILDLPRRNGSVLQAITSAFVSWMIKQRLRDDRPLVLSLFARSQNQYLFPGSVENGKKHILDDRGLVKWWCKTLDPVLREYAPEPTEGSTSIETSAGHEAIFSKAYLTVPGHDSYETQSFFPPSFRADPLNQRRWTHSHPLFQISSYPGAPPRCLVPHFPDDPKARFLNDLDDELVDIPQSVKTSSTHDSPTKRGKGQWKSIRTIEQFWELMAFRQECSSGRLVGFIWIVFTPKDLLASQKDGSNSNTSSMSPSSLKRKATEIESSPQSRARQSKPDKAGLQRKKRPKKLRGPIIPRLPRVKSSNAATDIQCAPQSVTTRYYHWPPESRGMLVLTQKAYDRVHELLLRLDFSNLEVSRASTRRWLSETGLIAGRVSDAWRWGRSVSGMKGPKRNETEAAGSDATTTKEVDNRQKTAKTLPAKKPKPEVSGQPDATVNDEAATKVGSDSSTNLLSSSLVRKKPKPEASKPLNDAQSTKPEESALQNGVNNLSAGLIRKKPKS